MEWTLQKLIDGKMTVAEHCHNPRCHHTEKLDLEAIRDRFGPDFPAMADDLLPKLRCSMCGQKAGGLTPVWRALMALSSPVNV